MGYGPWGMEFWQLITLVCVFAWLFKPKESRRFERIFDDFSTTHAKEKAAYEDALDACEEDLDSAEARMKKMEERIRILEKIVTENYRSSALSEEIEKLREAGNER